VQCHLSDFHKHCSQNLQNFNKCLNYYLEYKVLAYRCTYFNDSSNGSTVHLSCHEDHLTFVSYLEVYLGLDLELFVDYPHKICWVCQPVFVCVPVSSYSVWIPSSVSHSRTCPSLQQKSEIYICWSIFKQTNLKLTFLKLKSTMCKTTSHSRP